MNYPKIKFAYNQTDSIDIIIHGGSKGIESHFINKLFNASTNENHSTLAFNFPYLDRGDESSSGEELVEEQDTIDNILDFLKRFSFKKIHFIAKSLGGIVLAKYIANNGERLTSFEIEVTILGYVLGDIDLSGFTGRLTIIQGSNDRFGNADAVKDDLATKKLSEANVIEIEGADHSYRIPETKEPKFEDEVVSLVFSDNNEIR
ncbi:MAG: hypothetical protein Kow0081_3940 [Candidatus Dojkabacteria bacterium]